MPAFGRYAAPMALRLAAWLGALLCGGVVGAAAGRLGVALGVMGVLAAFGVVHVVLPRAAHGRFTRGRPRAARWRYALLRRLVLTPRGARRARLSCVACDLAAGAYAAAAAGLAALPEASLDVDERATWLGNRAYLALRDPAAVAERGGALAWADAAMALRPDVLALGHTRALALAHLGRSAEAIAALEALWSTSPLPPLLEAERCWDLAALWAARGEHAYADDYRARAHAALDELRVRPAWLRLG